MVAWEKSTDVTEEPMKASSPILVTSIVLPLYSTSAGMTTSDETPSHPITVTLLVLATS